MKKAALLLFLLAAGGLAAGTASAHGHARVHFGVFVGGPVWGPWYYPPPYYYYPTPVFVTPPAPPVYVERQDAAPSVQPSQDWWYYCEQSRGYYPYVKSCPGGWQRVPPAPPPG